MNITYGPLNPRAWEQFKNFRLMALQQAPEAFGSTYQTEVEFAPATWQEWIPNMVFAEQDGTIIGMIGVVPDPLTANLKIISFYVLPTKRGQGIGTALINYLINEYAHNKTLTLTVRQSNAALITYYEKLGFVVVGKNEEGYTMQKID